MKTKHECRWCRYFKDDGFYIFCNHPSLFEQSEDSAGRYYRYLKGKFSIMRLSEIKKSVCKGRWWRFGLIRAIVEVFGI